MDWGCSPGVEHLAGMHEALGSIPSTEEEKVTKFYQARQETKYGSVSWTLLPETRQEETPPTDALVWGLRQGPPLPLLRRDWIFLHGRASCAP